MRAAAPDGLDPGDDDDGSRCWAGDHVAPSDALPPAVPTAEPLEAEPVAEQALLLVAAVIDGGVEFADLGIGTEAACGAIEVI